jgi:hypothetical protein
VWAWIKSKAGYVAAVLGIVLAALVTRSLSKSEIKAALALRRLTDAVKSHEAAQAHADALEQKADTLAEALLAEELELAARKKEADALSVDAIIADLRRRGLIK